MSRLKGDVLWSLGEREAASELTRTTLERMHTVLGDDHEETLIAGRSHTMMLRARGT
jgi:hypothetical protein